MALRPYKNLVGEYVVVSGHNACSDVSYHEEGGILMLKHDECYPTDRPFYQPAQTNESVYLVDEVHHGIKSSYDIRYLTYCGRWQFKFSDIRDARWFILRFIDG
jgi:hypothetical protein